MLWTSYNYPYSLNSSGKNVYLYYDPNRQRYEQVYTSGSATETTMYVGKLLEKVTSGSVSDWRHYIRANGQQLGRGLRLYGPGHHQVDQP